MLKPVARGNRAEHDEDEERAGDVDAGHQLAERDAATRRRSGRR